MHHIFSNMAVHPISDANEKSPFGSFTPSEFYARHSVTHSSDYVTNSRGLKLFTQWWAPLPPTTVTGIVAVVHGFTSESSWFIQLTSILFAKSGFATCTIDLPGHGFSDGLRAHIPDINPLVADCISFFDSFRARHPPSLPSFLYAESFGGAVALFLTFLQKGKWDGLVLSGAMCGVSPKFKPLWPLEHFLGFVAAIAPTWRMLPTRGPLVDMCFRVDWKKKLAMANPRKPPTVPRAATAQELLRVSKEVQGRMEEVELPLLIVHGGNDVVCNPQNAKDLYCSAASKDKTLKIYPGMWHQLIGESQEDVDLVFGNIVEWLRDRSTHKTCKSN